ncbi:MAG: epoxyqueuosine reductase QueH [Candidatus Omnitrophota bacterium]
MRLLLHTCCAPCAIYPVREAKKDNYVVTGFFYNPNIHPYSEYIRRRREAEIYFKSEGLELLVPEYDTDDFFKNIRTSRCGVCRNIRLEKTASFAKEKGFDSFTTTLLGSPYQDHNPLTELCENLSKGTGLNLYYKDFRIGFGDAHKAAREKGMYCQNYCGCVFSMVEREEARKVKTRSQSHKVTSRVTL